MLINAGEDRVLLTTASPAAVAQEVRRTSRLQMDLAGFHVRDVPQAGWISNPQRLFVWSEEERRPESNSQDHSRSPAIM